MTDGLCRDEESKVKRTKVKRASTKSVSQIEGKRKKKQ